MQLLAVVVPPPEVVRDVLEAAHRLCSTPEAATDEPRRGLLGRLRGRRDAAPPVAAPTLRPTTPEAVFVRLATFGNVTGSDAGTLADALGSAAGTWPAPVLHIGRLRVTEAEPHVVTADLDGDVDALRDIHRNVNEVARQQRFFLDRRGFRSEMVLGTMRVDDESAPPLAGVEVPFRGAYWSPSHVSLLRATYGAGGTTFTEYARIELGDDATEPVAPG
jgi:2'-5' RNA ligase